MSILIDKNTKVLVQGITGSEGSFHSEKMLEYGTNIVAGVTPGKGGLKAVNDNVPAFNSVKEAKEKTGATASIIFVPPAFAAEAILESVYSDVKVIVCISEGVPAKNMIEVKSLCKQKKVSLIGPNCPGIITVDECKLGIMPGFICKKGDIGVISKSGTLTYEAIDQIVKNNMGITTAIGIGGDPIIGTSMKDALKMFQNDNKTKGIVLIGEIGGQMEIEAANWAKDNCNKPIVGFIAGQTAPPGRRMGHAGAIVSGGNETAEAKMKILSDCGVNISKSVGDIGQIMKEKMDQKHYAK